MPAPETSIPVRTFPPGTAFSIAAAPPLFFWATLRSLPNDPEVFEAARIRLIEIDVLNSRGGTLAWPS